MTPLEEGATRLRNALHLRPGPAAARRSGADWRLFCLSHPIAQLQLKPWSNTLRESRPARGRVATTSTVTRKWSWGRAGGGPTPTDRV